MAAPTVTLDSPRPLRLGNSQFCVLSGQVTVTNYDTNHPPLTALTSVFKGGIVRCSPSGVTTTALVPRWDDTTSSFLLYGTNSAGGSLIEAAAGSGTNGSFDFIAVGRLGL